MFCVTWILRYNLLNGRSTNDQYGEGNTVVVGSQVSRNTAREPPEDRRWSSYQRTRLARDVTLLPGAVGTQEAGPNK
ncbi:hypothetical protein J6590_052154 [Homalodisca vitripennis]|nr:hypothetical protein J6590_052154 [Homalodisca vitripennis]